MYGFLADAVVVFHLLFVLFVILGGLLVLRWRRAVWFHLPAVFWGIFVEFSGWICPLTPLENWLRYQGGRAAYDTGFVAHYILPVLYPAGLTRQIQFVLGSLILLLNLGVYGWIWYRFRRGKKEEQSSLE